MSEYKFEIGEQVELTKYGMNKSILCEMIMHDKKIIISAKKEEYNERYYNIRGKSGWFFESRFKKHETFIEFITEKEMLV